MRWQPMPLAVLFVAGLALFSPPASAEIATIWALDDSTKVKATDLQHRLEPRNGIWDGSTVRIFGMRNETVAFQLVLEGGAAQTGPVTVRLDGIGTIANGAVSNNPDSYFLNRNIELFKVEYVNVTERTNELMWEHPNAMPDGWMGWIPDPLVPLNLLREPLRVPARRNQGVWVDIYIPKSTSPGLHQGWVTVEVNGRTCAESMCRIPVELEVLATTLPDSPTAKTMMWSSVSDMPVERRYFDPNSTPQAPKDRLRERHFKLARRHHITMFMGISQAPNDEILKRVNGTIFSASQGYYGWGQDVGQDVYSILTYGHQHINSTEARTWTDWFSRNAPHVEYFHYVHDEPNLNNRGLVERINDIAAVAKPVPGFITAHFTPQLSQLDIFCFSSTLYSPEDAAAANAAGKTAMIYNGTRPWTGSIAIDDVAVSLRVNAWIQYKYNIHRWFYWESTYYEDFQGQRGDINIWREPLNFSNGPNGTGNRVNGDGMVIYPGRDRIFPEEDRGFDGPLPSLRLKNWRRGLQDAEYLAIAERAGFTGQINAALSELVTDGVLQGTDWDRAVSWNEDGERWLAHRRTIATAIASLSPEQAEVFSAPLPTAPSPQNPTPSNPSNDPPVTSPTVTEPSQGDPINLDLIASERQQRARSDGLAMSSTCSTGKGGHGAMPSLLVLIALLAVRSRRRRRSH